MKPCKPYLITKRISQGTEESEQFVPMNLNLYLIPLKWILKLKWMRSLSHSNRDGLRRWMFHLIKDEICNVTGGRNVAVAAVNTPAQKLRISQDQKERRREGGQRGSEWVFIHSFIHDEQKSMSDIPLHAARSKKVGKLSGNEETTEVKQVT